MKMLASKLSTGFLQLRVDFYDVDGKVYFGELTLFHHGGMVPFVPEKWDEIFGQWMELSDFFGRGLSFVRLMSLSSNMVV